MPPSNFYCMLGLCGNVFKFQPVFAVRMEEDGGVWGAAYPQPTLRLAVAKLPEYDSGLATLYPSARPGL